MDFKKLEKINEKAYTTSNIELLLDEYLELFQNTVASIKNRESFEREEDYLKKILFSTRIKRNKYSNYREFVALIVARIVKITEDYNTTNYLMRKNINEENIELFYFYAKNNQASIPELQNDIDDFYEKMKYEAREKFIISSIYDGEKVFLEEKNFYYGSCKTASKKIKDLAISYRLKPRLLLEEVKRKIEQRDIMDLHKLVYKYLEVTGDFDTELLYTVFRFLLKNKISKPVFEMLELYTLRFKMRTSLDANLMLYVCSYCKGSKKRVKLELYLKSLEIYLYKKPIDTVMALIYIGTLIDNYPYEAKEKFIKYLKSIPQKDIAYIFLENIIPKIPEEWSFKPIELKKIVQSMEKARAFQAKNESIFMNELPRLSKKEIEEKLDQYALDSRIDFALFALNIVKALKKDKRQMKTLVIILEKLFDLKQCVEEMYIYRPLYFYIKYELGLDKEEALKELEIMSLYDIGALSFISKIAFDNHFENGEYELCYRDLFNILNSHQLQECAKKLEEANNIDISEFYRYIKRKIADRNNLERAPKVIKDVKDDTIYSVIEIKEKLKRKLPNKKNEITFSYIKKAFSVENIEISCKKHIRTHSRLNFLKKEHSIFLIDPFEAINNVMENPEEHEYVICYTKFTITAPYPKVGYKFDSKGKIIYCEKITLAFSVFDKKLISAYPV